MRKNDTRAMDVAILIAAWDARIFNPETKTDEFVIRDAVRAVRGDVSDATCYAVSERMQHSDLITHNAIKGHMTLGSRGKAMIALINGTVFGYHDGI